MPGGATGYRKWYAAAGASFGLMMAAKYFPHYLGLIFLYYLLPPYRREYPPFQQARLFVFCWVTCALVFLIANPCHPVSRHDQNTCCITSATAR